MIAARGLLGTFVLVLATGCAGHSRSGIMTWEEYGKLSHPYPYILRIDSRGGRLVYFGSRHIYDAADPLVVQIQQLWEEFAPTLALNEGGDPPVASTIENAVGQFGEAGLVRYLAARDDVPVRSLEPDRMQESSHLAPDYSPEQIKLFYVLRQVPHYRRAALPISMEKKVEEDLGIIARQYGLEGKPRTLAEIQELCDTLLPEVTNWRDVPQSFFDPLAKTRHFTNDISRRLSDLRDEHMVDLLNREVSKGARVFAVVGGSHVVMQEPALRDLLR